MAARLALFITLAAIIMTVGLTACAEQQPATEAAQNNAAVTREPAPADRNPALFISEEAAQEAVEVMEQALTALGNNDVEAYKAAYRQNDFVLPEDAVFSLEIVNITVDWQETARYRDMYTGTQPAERNGWSDEYLQNNFIVIYAEYIVDYDNTKVPDFEGRLTQYFFLTREDENSPWKIWDKTSPSDTPVDFGT